MFTDLTRYGGLPSLAEMTFQNDYKRYSGWSKGLLKVDTIYINRTMRESMAAAALGSYGGI